jgi:hypothetical protein
MAGNVSLKGVDWSNLDSVKKLAQKIVDQGGPHQVVIKGYRPGHGTSYRVTFLSRANESVSRSGGVVVWRSDTGDVK